MCSWYSNTLAAWLLKSQTLLGKIYNLQTGDSVKFILFRPCLFSTILGDAAKDQCNVEQFSSFCEQSREADTPQGKTLTEFFAKKSCATFITKWKSQWGWNIWDIYIN